MQKYGGNRVRCVIGMLFGIFFYFIQFVQFNFVNAAERKQSWVKKIMKYTLGLSKKAIFNLRKNQAQLTRKQSRKYPPFFPDVFKKDRVNENMALPFNQILAMQGNGIAQKNDLYPRV